MNWARLAPLRTALLTLLGFTLLTIAGWMIFVPLGLLIAGVSAFLLEYLTSPRAAGVSS